MSFSKIRDAWVWPDSVERHFRKHMDGYTLHVCCGESNIGDVTIDADPENDPDIVADMNNLPVSSALFDTVICDPPWKEIQVIGGKHRLFFELLRVVKPRGTVLWNAYSIPQSEQASCDKVWVRQDHKGGKSSVIAKYTRYPGQQTLTEVRR
jgi:hypothetical protein